MCVKKETNAAHISIKVNKLLLRYHSAVFCETDFYDDNVADDGGVKRFIWKPNSKLPRRVNFTNILRAAFAPISLC